ncbi:aspartate aminotransferase family protein [uncultured Megasphaera sp.]|uniref:aspartate aminotransferase family protein n=1 Tax=uncultured Megasphaera sp. TaxID=165188 RepID=UPI0026596BC2|nr:aspartate aminotransferase family protein [uncultured Megasphaera sp.]
MLNQELPKIITKTVPGPKAAELIKQRDEETPAAIHCGYPCVMDEAQGAMIKDVDGNLFLDWVGGVGVLNVGHSHPEVVAAVKAQADKYMHGMFNIVTHEGYVKLAAELNKRVPVRGDKKQTMFANSGAEADENAVKIAKAYTKRPNIIVFSGAFHGRTVMTMAMTSKKAYAVGMGPFPDGVYRAKYPYLYHRPAELTEEEAIQMDIDSLTDVFEEASPAEYVAAVVLEPLQGEGGFIPAPIEWVRKVREICDAHGILMIADEVQSGFGRTGRLFASEYWKEAGIMPDIIASAKSIAGGVPLSMVTARKEIFDAVPNGVIGGTFGGNALACAAGLKVLELMDRDHLPERSLEIGKKYMDTVNSWKEKYAVIGDVRGLGGMVGVEFVKDQETKEPNGEFVAKLVADAAQHGLLIENAGTHGQVVRFLAPLVMTDAQLDAGLAIFEASIRRVLGLE